MTRPSWSASGQISSAEARLQGLLVSQDLVILTQVWKSVCQLQVIECKRSWRSYSEPLVQQNILLIKGHFWL